MNVNTDSTEMLKQTYILDESLRVADVLLGAGINLNDFVRFECGEPLETDPED